VGWFDWHLFATLDLVGSGCIFSDEREKLATIGEALARGRRALAQSIQSGDNDARLDAQVLLGYVLGVEHAYLYTYPERELSAQEEQQYRELIDRRVRHEPVAYLTGIRVFYGRDFFVDRRVLVPRPETELLVEAALEQIRRRLATGQLPLVADIGTGSGAIPVTIALEEEQLGYLYASDLSSDALDVARINCERYHVEQRVRLLHGNLLAPLPEPVDILIANLPYVGTSEEPLLAPDVLNYEPHLALFSGPDGLELLRRFCQEVRESAKVKPGAVILLEIGYQQREPLIRLFQDLFPQSHITAQKDYAGWDRIVQIEL